MSPSANPPLPQWRKEGRRERGRRRRRRRRRKKKRNPIQNTSNLPARNGRFGGKRLIGLPCARRGQTNDHNVYVVYFQKDRIYVWDRKGRYHRNTVYIRTSPLDREGKMKGNFTSTNVCIFPGFFFFLQRNERKNNKQNNQETHTSRDGNGYYREAIANLSPPPPPKKNIFKSEKKPRS